MSTCLTCMGSQVRVLYCPPSSRTKKDIYAKNPEVSTASGFFCAHFLKLEKKISKRVLAKSVDLNLYARDFGPLFRSFFGKAARFCSRQNVEFRPVFLLVMPNTHSKHRCQRVSRLCDVSDVKTAGIIPMESNRQTSPRIKGRHLKENCCSPRWRSFIYEAYSILPEHLREAAFQPMLHQFRSAAARFAGAIADNGTDLSHVRQRRPERKLHRHRV